jgi:hypothetical protein
MHLDVGPTSPLQTLAYLHPHSDFVGPRPQSTGLGVGCWNMQKPCNGDSAASALRMLGLPKHTRVVDRLMSEQAGGVCIAKSAPGVRLLRSDLAWPLKTLLLDPGLAGSLVGAS